MNTRNLSLPFLSSCFSCASGKLYLLIFLLLKSAFIMLINSFIVESRNDCLLVLDSYWLKSLIQYTSAEGFWSTMALINFLQGNISWQWSCCHFIWVVWKSAGWYLESWTRIALWCCCHISSHRNGCNISVMDGELWRHFREQGHAYSIQGRSCSNCLRYS